MKKDMKKKATPVTLDDLKNLIKETAEAMGGKLSQDDLDAFLTKYDLDDESAEELLSFITDNDILIEDGFDALDDIDDDQLMSGMASDLDDLEALETLDDLDNLDDLDSDIDNDVADLDFGGDFDMLTGDTVNMYSNEEEDDSNQLGSNVKINDPVKMYLKEIGRVELLSHDEEISEKMDGMTPEKVREIQKISLEPVSLETPIGEEDDSHLGDFIEDEGAMSPDDYAANELLKDELNEVLLELTDREEKVLRLRFGLDDGRTRTLEEVGKEFNVTRERIRQIEAKALRKLKHPSRSKRLKDFLDR